MRSLVTELLLFPVSNYRVGVIGSVLAPVIGIARPPLPWAIATDVAVFGIGGDFLPAIIGPALTLTANFATGCLERSKLRCLKGLLAIAAAPFPHYRVVAPCVQPPTQGEKVADLFLVEIGSRQQRPPFSQI
jgi:hypothetical protein